MLQRIQTIWLALASVCAFLTLRFSFYSGNKLVNGISQFEPLTATDKLILLVLTVAVAITCVITIFLYKQRGTQMKIGFAALAVSIINIILFFSAVGDFVEGSYDLTAPLAFAVPVFILLAITAIYKDQKLVKSVDRLR